MKTELYDRLIGGPEDGKRLDRELARHSVIVVALKSKLSAVSQCELDERTLQFEEARYDKRFFRCGDTDHAMFVHDRVSDSAALSILLDRHRSSEGMREFVSDAADLLFEALNQMAGIMGGKLYGSMSKMIGRASKLIR